MSVPRRGGRSPVRAAAALLLAAAAVLALPAPGPADARAPADPPGPPPVPHRPAVAEVAGADTLTSADVREGVEWSFPPGEESRYRVAVALGPAGAAGTVGSARLAVEGPAEVDGREATRVVMEMEARVPLVYRMRSRRTSWVATGPFRSLRFEEHLREGDYRRHRRYRLHQDAGTYTRYDRAGEEGPDPEGDPNPVGAAAGESDRWRPVAGESGVPMPPAALDEISFLYFLRALPLEVGETYRFRRMFEEDGNPVVLEVLRRERIRVPAGRFETVVVRPVIRGGGLFSQGGEAEVYLSDDERRVIVRVDSRMKVGRLHLYLEEHRPGAHAGPADG